MTVMYSLFATGASVHFVVYGAPTEYSTAPLLESALISETARPDIKTNSSISAAAYL